MGDVFHFLDGGTDISEFLHGGFSAKLTLPSSGTVIHFVIVSNTFLSEQGGNTADKKDRSIQMFFDLDGILLRFSCRAKLFRSPLEYRLVQLVPNCHYGSLDTSSLATCRTWRIALEYAQWIRLFLGPFARVRPALGEVYLRADLS